MSDMAIPPIDSVQLGEKPGQIIMPLEVAHETLSVLSSEARAVILGSINVRSGDEMAGIVSPTYLYRHLGEKLPVGCDQIEVLGKPNAFGETLKRLTMRGVLEPGEPALPRKGSKAFYQFTPLGEYASLNAGVLTDFTRKTGIPLATVLSSHNGTRARTGEKPETDQTLVRLESLRHLVEYQDEPLTTADLIELLGSSAPNHTSMVSRMIRSIELSGLITVELVERDDMSPGFENTGPVGSDLSFYADNAQSLAIRQLLRATDTVMRPTIPALEDSMVDFEELISESDDLLDVLLAAKRGKAKEGAVYREGLRSALTEAFSRGETFSTDAAAEALNIKPTHATFALRGLRSCVGLVNTSSDLTDRWEY